MMMPPRDMQGEPKLTPREKYLKRVRSGATGSRPMPTPKRERKRSKRKSARAARRANR